MSADLSSSDGRNTAVGSEAAKAITGSDNTYIGARSGDAASSGDSNTAVGSDSLGAQTTASNNTAVGKNALDANTEGHSNVAIGKDALGANIVGDELVAIGMDALAVYTSTAGASSKSTAVGFAAGKANVGVYAANNTFIGYQAGTAVTSAGSLTCIGSGAADTETTGNDSIYIGVNSNGGASGSNSQNTALGNATMAAASAGHNNTAIGHSALNDHTSGTYNTCLGKEAGDKITSGSNNVMIGHDAGSDGLTTITTGSNNIVIGNVSTAVAEVKVDWTVGSDQRDKTDIETLPDNAGLNFVNQMRPVTYVWDNRSNYYKPTDENFGERDHSKKSKIKQVGFIAQEIKAIEESIGWTDDHIVNTSNERSYKLQHSQIIPMLVKSIQELSAKVEELENKGE
jgi:hypothetical protein